MRLLVVLVAVSLAGCMVQERDHAFTVPEDAPDHVDTYTGDGYNLRVHVTDELGNPIQGAAVVIFHASGVFGGSVSAEASAQAGGSRAVSSWEADFTSYDSIAGLRTNAEGVASADLEPSDVVNVAAGDADGLTTEVISGVTVGSGGSSGTVTVPLYPTTVTYQRNVTIQNLEGTPGISMDNSQPVALFPDDQAYQNRIHSLKGSITWINDVEGEADFSLGIGGDELMWADNNERQLPLSGSNTETLNVGANDLKGHRQDMADQGYTAFVMTEWGAAVNGMEVFLLVEADLKGSNIVLN